MSSCEFMCTVTTLPILFYPLDSSENVTENYSENREEFLYTCASLELSIVVTNGVNIHLTFIVRI